MSDETVFSVDSQRSVEEVQRAIEEACGKHSFGVLGFHDLRQKMQAKGVDFERECRVLDVCNPHQARKVLEEDPRISTVLPCRISVYAVDGGTRLATVRPSKMLSMFGATALDPVAREVEEALVAIMQEAAG